MKHNAKIQADGLPTGIVRAKPQDLEQYRREYAAEMKTYDSGTVSWAKDLGDLFRLRQLLFHGKKFAAIEEEEARNFAAPCLPFPEQSVQNQTNREHSIKEP